MTKIDNKSIITKKARKKFFSENIALNLIRYNPKSDMLKAYWNTYHCSEVIWTTDRVKLKTTYCKNRWCPTCQSIRVATLLTAYETALSGLNDCYFVTLTRPTVTAEELPLQIKRMNDCWRSLYKKGNQQKRQMKGCRKSECTLTKGRYHFHYHVVVQGKENAQWLLDEWLQRNPESNKLGQNVKECDNMKMIELFKYVTKLSFKTKTSSKSHQFKALDTIFRAMKGKRVYNSFGIKRIDENNINDDKVDISDIQVQLFAWYKTDWFNKKTAEPLTNYSPEPDIQDWFHVHNDDYGEP